MTEFVGAVFLLVAVVCAALRAVHTPSRVDLGWVAITCVVVAIWLLPQLLVVGWLR